MLIRLASKLQKDSIVDGEGIRAVIWTQGCPHHCPSCHNPETWDYDGGFSYDVEDLKAKTSIGIGIGLFGIFSIMRYRTDAMPVREMTYMFVIIALSVVNAIANSVSIVELLVTNVIVILCIWVCEKRLKQVPTKLIQYDRIELTQPEHRQELKDDLQKRLGLDIVRIDVGSVDFLRDMVMLKVYYQGDRSDETLNNTLKLKNNDLTNFSNN